jgi:hypothetical protein
MAITLSNVNIGTGPGVGNGDPLRTAFTKINNNFAVLQANINTPAVSSTPPLTLIGTYPTHSNSAGTIGQVSYISGNLYICVAPNTWVKSTVITSF